MRRFVLDTNCFVDAARVDRANEALVAFAAAVAPGLLLSSVVAAELRAGAVELAAAKRLEATVLAPYERRGRVLTPSRIAWKTLGTTLAALARRDGLDVRSTPRSFVFDILIAYSCREVGAVLISSNTRDLNRIGRVFRFEHVKPYPAM